MKLKLDPLFHPKVIAVAGASKRPGSAGEAIIKHLIGSKFEGTIHPVNPKERSILSVKCYRSVLRVPEPVDLAIVATPDHKVITVIKECFEANVGAIIVVTGAFNTEDQKEQMNEIREICSEKTIPLLGTNSFGLIHPNSFLNASFADKMPKAGKVAFISQSTAISSAILDWAEWKNMGFSYFISLGYTLNIDFHHLIDYFGADPYTNSILVYMDFLTEARIFMSASRAFSRNKPVIVLKGGRNAKGTQIIKETVGREIGAFKTYRAAFQRAGIIQVNTIQQLFDTAQALGMQPRPKGNRLAIITNSNAPGILATDYLLENGGELPEFSQKTLAALGAVLPETFIRNNFIRLFANAEPDLYVHIVDICLNDPNIDGVLVIHSPQFNTQCSSIARALGEKFSYTSKTMLTVWMGYEEVAESWDLLEDHKIPVYRFPESAVDTFLLMYTYAKNIESLYQMVPSVPEDFNPKKEAVRQLLKEVRAQQRTILNREEAKKLLSLYEIPAIDHVEVNDLKEALTAARKLVYPVLIKLASPQILHEERSEWEVLDINNDQQLEGAYRLLNEKLEKTPESFPGYRIYLEKMHLTDYKLIIGSEKNSIFGPVLFFGMGGVAKDVYGDINYGLPPLNMALALRMIEGTKIYHLLKKGNYFPGADILSIQYLLYKFSYLVMEFPELKKVIMNTFAIDRKGGLVSDAYIELVESAESKEGPDYSHLVISPYPEEYIKKVTLKNGQEVLFRPIKPEDEPLEREMIKKFSKKSIYYRFFGYINHISHQFLNRFTHIDYDREIAIIVEMEEDDKTVMAGVVRMVADAYNEHAEYAIAIADPYQRLGLGNLLTDYILEIARERGIKKIFASVLKENEGMLHIFRKKGFSFEEEDFNTFYVELEL